jgi:hypothetical protein
MAEPPDGTLLDWGEVTSQVKWQTLLLGEVLVMNRAGKITDSKSVPA